MVLLQENVGGSVTEEGKRTCPLADRPILEAHRLPSSVTAPQSFLLVCRCFMTKRHHTDDHTAQVPRHLLLGRRLWCERKATSKNSLLPGSPLHIFIRSAQVFLGDVGAHPCVRPDREPLFSLDKTV